LLRDVLDSHAKTELGNIGRKRNYDDEIQCYDYEPPENVPEWAFEKQPNAMYDSNPDYDDNDDNDAKSSNKSNPATPATDAE
jgi:hypothetical protein